MQTNAPHPKSANRYVARIASSSTIMGSICETAACTTPSYKTSGACGRGGSFVVHASMSFVFIVVEKKMLSGSISVCTMTCS